MDILAPKMYKLTPKMTY